MCKKHNFYDVLFMRISHWEDYFPIPLTIENMQEIIDMLLLDEESLIIGSKTVANEEEAKSISKLILFLRKKIHEQKGENRNDKIEI